MRHATRKTFAVNTAQQRAHRNLKVLLGDLHLRFQIRAAMARFILLQKTKNGSGNTSNASEGAILFRSDLGRRTDIQRRTDPPRHNISTQLGKKFRTNPSAEEVSVHKSPSNPSNEKQTQAIGPPRLHHDVKLICSEFGITEQSKYALRRYDATKLEDFCLMTDDDFDELVLTEARMGRPMCPLQQRKLRVLLEWARSLATTGNLGKSGFEGNENNNGAVKPGGKIIPADWEDWESRFYSDLPSLRKKLQKLGEPKLQSDWVTKFASLIFCDCGK
jgi:hypothetical protein